MRIFVGRRRRRVCHAAVRSAARRDADTDILRGDREQRAARKGNGIVRARALRVDHIRARVDRVFGDRESQVEIAVRIARRNAVSLILFLQNIGFSARIYRALRENFHVYFCRGDRAHGASARSDVIVRRIFVAFLKRRGEGIRRSCILEVALKGRGHNQLDAAALPEQRVVRSRRRRLNLPVIDEPFRAVPDDRYGRFADRKFAFDRFGRGIVCAIRDRNDDIVRSRGRAVRERAEVDRDRAIGVGIIRNGDVAEFCRRQFFRRRRAAVRPAGARIFVVQPGICRLRDVPTDGYAARSFVFPLVVVGVDEADRKRIATRVRARCAAHSVISSVFRIGILKRYYTAVIFGAEIFGISGRRFHFIALDRPIDLHARLGKRLAVLQPAVVGGVGKRDLNKVVRADHVGLQIPRAAAVNEGDVFAGESLGHERVVEADELARDRRAVVVNAVFHRRDLDGLFIDRVIYPRRLFPLVIRVGDDRADAVRARAEERGGSAVPTAAHAALELIFDRAGINAVSALEGDLNVDVLRGKADAVDPAFLHIEPFDGFASERAVFQPEQLFIDRDARDFDADVSVYSDTPFDRPILCIAVAVVARIAFPYVVVKVFEFKLYGIPARRGSGHDKHVFALHGRRNDLPAVGGLPGIRNNADDVRIELHRRHIRIARRLRVAVVDAVADKRGRFDALFEDAVRQVDIFYAAVLRASAVNDVIGALDRHAHRIDARKGRVLRYPLFLVRPYAVIRCTVIDVRKRDVRSDFIVADKPLISAHADDVGLRSTDIPEALGLFELTAVVHAVHFAVIVVRVHGKIDPALCHFDRAVRIVALIGKHIVRQLCFERQCDRQPCSRGRGVILILHAVPVRCLQIPHNVLTVILHVVAEQALDHEIFEQFAVVQRVAVPHDDVLYAVRRQVAVQRNVQLRFFDLPFDVARVGERITACIGVVQRHGDIIRARIDDFSRNGFIAVAVLREVRKREAEMLAERFAADLAVDIVGGHDRFLRVRGVYSGQIRFEAAVDPNIPLYDRKGSLSFEGETVIVKGHKSRIDTDVDLRSLFRTVQTAGIIAVIVQPGREVYLLLVAFVYEREAALVVRPLVREREQVFVHLVAVDDRVICVIRCRNDERAGRDRIDRRVARTRLVIPAEGHDVIETARFVYGAGDLVIAADVRQRRCVRRERKHRFGRVVNIAFFVIVSQGGKVVAVFARLVVDINRDRGALYGKRTRIDRRQHVVLRVSFGKRYGKGISARVLELARAAYLLREPALQGVRLVRGHLGGKRDALPLVHRPVYIRVIRRRDRLWLIVIRIGLGFAAVPHDVDRARGDRESRADLCRRIVFVVAFESNGIYPGIRRRGVRIVIRAVFARVVREHAYAGDVLPGSDLRRDRVRITVVCDRIVTDYIDLQRLRIDDVPARFFVLYGIPAFDRDDVIVRHNVVENEVIRARTRFGAAEIAVERQIFLRLRVIPIHGKAVDFPCGIFGVRTARAARIQAARRDACLFIQVARVSVGAYIIAQYDGDRPLADGQRAVFIFERIVARREAACRDRILRRVVALPIRAVKCKPAFVDACGLRGFAGDKIGLGITDRIIIGNGIAVGDGFIVRLDVHRLLRDLVALAVRARKLIIRVADRNGDGIFARKRGIFLRIVGFVALRVVPARICIGESEIVSRDAIGQRFVYARACADRFAVDETFLDERIEIERDLARGDLERSCRRRGNFVIARRERARLIRNGVCSARRAAFRARFVVCGISYFAFEDGFRLSLYEARDVIAEHRIVAVDDGAVRLVRFHGQVRLGDREILLGIAQVFVFIHGDVIVVCLVARKRCLGGVTVRIYVYGGAPVIRVIGNFGGDHVFVHRAADLCGHFLRLAAVSDGKSALIADKGKVDLDLPRGDRVSARFKLHGVIAVRSRARNGICARVGRFRNVCGGKRPRVRVIPDEPVPAAQRVDIGGEPDDLVAVNTRLVGDVYGDLAPRNRQRAFVHDDVIIARARSDRCERLFGKGDGIRVYAALPFDIIAEEVFLFFDKVFQELFIPGDNVSILLDRPIGSGFAVDRGMIFRNDDGQISLPDRKLNALGIFRIEHIIFVVRNARRYRIRADVFRRGSAVIIARARIREGDGNRVVVVAVFKFVPVRDDVAVGIRILPARDDDGELARRNAYLLAAFVSDIIILRPVPDVCGRVERDRVIADIAALFITAGDRVFDRSEEVGPVLRLLIAVNRDPAICGKNPLAKRIAVSNLLPFYHNGKFRGRDDIFGGSALQFFPCRTVLDVIVGIGDGRGDGIIADVLREGGTERLFAFEICKRNGGSFFAVAVFIPFDRNGSRSRRAVYEGIAVVKRIARKRDRQLFGSDFERIFVIQADIHRPVVAAFHFGNIDNDAVLAHILRNNRTAEPLILPCAVIASFYAEIIIRNGDRAPFDRILNLVVFSRNIIFDNGSSSINIRHGAAFKRDFDRVVRLGDLEPETFCYAASVDQRVVQVRFAARYGGVRPFVVFCIF